MKADEVDEFGVAAALSGLAEAQIAKALVDLVGGWRLMNRQNDNLIQLGESKDALIHDLRLVIGQKDEQIENLLLQIEAHENDHALANAEARIAILERALRRVGWEDWQRLNINLDYWDFHGDQEHGES